MKSTNTKWFTLVELIIVITILAVLATIAFISFQGYSQEAKDSGKMSEMSEIVKSIAIKEAREGLQLSSLVDSGALNKAAVGINSENKYAIALNGSGTTYLIAGKMNKYTSADQAGVYPIWSSGSYFVLGTELVTSSWTIGTGTVTLQTFFGTALDEAK